jgi:hypothetical protein
MVGCKKCGADRQLKSPREDTEGILVCGGNATTTHILPKYSELRTSVGTGGAAPSAIHVIKRPFGTVHLGWYWWSWWELHPRPARLKQVALHAQTAI